MTSELSNNFTNNNVYVVSLVLIHPINLTSTEKRSEQKISTENENCT